jgi:hypothetical protein
MKATAKRRETEKYEVLTDPESNPFTNASSWFLSLRSKPVIEVTGEGSVY